MGWGPPYSTGESMLWSGSTPFVLRLLLIRHIKNMTEPLRLSLHYLVSVNLSRVIIQPFANVLFRSLLFYGYSVILEVVFVVVCIILT